ncbi:MAG: S-layer homology domain-containing protein [Oscillibacter sp.]|nr:S-layer homology domain-containing protein [Oscillibacter sp.]MEA4993054.1 S-layer homology domain-containing protein [Oscillibacter sp.]
MNICNALHKLTALALSVAMAVSMAPVSIAAETGINAISSSSKITAFEELAPEVTVQNVPIGTQKFELNLPKTLTATVLLAVYEEHPVLDSGEADSESDSADTVSGSAISIDETDEPETDGSEGDEIASPSDAEETGDSADKITVPLPVTWDASPEYDGETAGEYIFMPLLPEDVTLADGVELPAITVMVEEAALRTSGEITAFETLPDDLRWQNSIAPEFPETLDGMVAGEAAEIPVTWEADHDYDAEYPQRGLYVFTAVLEEGYGLAGGVELPRITVYIPQTVGGRMARMTGGGTSESPLEITTAAQLAEIATLVNARANGLELFLFNNADLQVTLELQNDLDLSGYASGEGWTPIGNDSCQFKGVFDGGGNKITGLSINRGADYQGLFGYVGTGGMVEDLGLEGININGSWRVGGVAGYINGSTVKNCYSTGSVTGTGNVVGGVVGHIQTGTVENCYSTGRVSGVGAVGGVAGYIKDGTVKNCYSTSSVTGTGSDAGGVTGYVYGGNVQNCAALNPSVDGGSNTGRMAGSNNTGTFSGNIAFGSMTVIQSGSPKATISDAQGLDGESKTAAEISAAEFFETLFASDTAWIYEPGKLPGFGVAIDMPAHIVDGSDLNFRGAGTSENPFQISTPAQLAKLAELINGAGTNAAYGGTGIYYKLQNDIDLSAYSSGGGWTPIGYHSYPFTGTFDGGSNKITNLTINRYGAEQGLFGFIDIGGTVKNLGVAGASVSGDIYVGGVAGKIGDGTVENCYSTGSVTGTGSGVGGVAGCVYTGTVENCYSTSSISGEAWIGGVAGYVEGGTVRNCYSTGSVSGDGVVGGVAGYVDVGGTVRNCCSTGSVTSTGYYVGGMVGIIVGVSSHVENCAALNSSVSGNAHVGRVAGNNTGTLSGNIAFGDITVTVNGDPKDIASDAAGLDGESKTAAEISAIGLFETLFDSDIAWTYAEGKLPGLGATIELPAHLLVAGAVPFEGAGTSESPYKISTAADLAKLAELVNGAGTNAVYGGTGIYYKLQNDIDLSAYSSGEGWTPIGNNPNAFKGIFDGNNKEISGLYINNSINDTGVFGYVEGGMFKNFSIVDVHIAGYNSAGGVAGYMDGGSVENCYVTGTVSVTGDYIGGMAGIVKGGCILKNCYTTVTVEGSSRVGGLAGYLEHSSAANCYSTGNVSATSGYVGGLVGFISVGSSVRNCAALNPSVSGALDVGRVAGWVGSCTLSNNYAFSRVPGTWENKGSGAKDGANVTSQILFGGSFWTTAANWDTDPWDSTVWTFADGKLPTLTGLAGQSGEGGLYLTARDIQYATVATIDTIPYNGSQQLPSLTVTFDGETLVKDADYTVSITSANGTGTSDGTNAGTVTLTITGKGNYTSTKSNITYTIVKKSVGITPNSGQSKKYGVADPVLTFTNDGSLDSDAFSGALSRASGENMGTYVISLGDLNAGSNYDLSLASSVVNFIIEKREVTLTADNKTIIKGGSLPGLTYTVSNLAPGETKADALSTEPTLACPTFDGNTLGEYAIILTGGTAKDNYTITTRTNGTLTVAEQTYTVTFNPNGGTRTGGGELIQTVAKGSAAMAPTVTRNGYTFTGWDKAFDNVTSNLTVTANWSYNGGGGSGSSSGGSSTTTTTTMPGKTPDQPITATVPVTAAAGATGAANASVPDKAITDAIAKAQADARAQGKTANGISVGLGVTMPKGATALTATLTQNSLNSLVSAGVTSLELDGVPVSFGLDLNALKEIQKQSSGDISITIAPATGLSKEAKALLGNRPVYSVTISYVDKNGKIQTITSLGNGTATLSIPYTPGKNEAVGYLFGVYVDANGKAQRIDGSAYDANSGSLLIPTGHFSIYGVGYTAPSAKFTDIGTHWGKEAIDYVVGRGLLSGTSKTTFAPDTAMTRGMLVTALGRLAGVDVKAYTTNSFTDVKADSAFRPYIEWAYKNGVVQGIGTQQFAPGRAITREEIAVIFANYAKATGYTLPVIREAVAYADASSIGSSYSDAVKAMQQAGIMMGGNDKKFNPKSNATRAELSSMLHRYIKLTITPATAQGWALNDDGQYLYYKDGKALTGTQTIDGVKYFFNNDGTLKTGWVQDGNNWRYYSGNKAAMGWLDISDKRYYFTKDGLMVSGKWLQIDGKWYYFNTDGSLTKSTKVDGYEVDENGVRKTKWQP